MTGFFRRSLIRGFAAASAAMLVSLPLAVPATTDLPKVIPSDALVAIWCNDVPSLTQSTKTSPYGQLWVDPGMEKLRTFVEGKFEEFDKELSEGGFPTLKESYEHLTGGVGLYITAPAGESINMDDVSRTFIIEFNDDGREWADNTAKNIANAFEEPTKESIDFQGTPIYKLSGKLKAPEGQDSPAIGETESTIYYALTKSHYVASDEPTGEGIKRAIANLSKMDEVSDRLISAPGMKTYQSKIKLQNDQLSVFVDLKRIIQDNADLKTAEAMVVSTLPSSGLYDFEGFAGSFTPSEKNITFDSSLVMATAKSGIVKALYEAGPADLGALQNVPSDALSANVFSLDLGKFYDAVLGIFEKANPQVSASVQMMLISQQAQYGVDIVNGILRNVKGTHIMYERPFADELKAQLSDEEQIQKSTGAILSFANGEETAKNLKAYLEALKKDPTFGGFFNLEESDGMTLVTVNDPGAMPDQKSGLGAYFAFSQKCLIIANNEIELRSAIRSTTQGNPASLLSVPKVKPSVDAAKAGEAGELHMFSYSPPEAIQYSIEQLQKLQDMGMMGEMGEFDASMIPSKETTAKYIGDTATTGKFTDNMVHFHMVTSGAK